MDSDLSLVQFAQLPDVLVREQRAEDIDELKNVSKLSAAVLGECNSLLRDSYSRFTSHPNFAKFNEIAHLHVVF